MVDLQVDLKKAAYEFVVQVHLPRGLASLLPKLRVCPLLPCLRCTSSPPSHLCSAFSPHYRSTWRTAHSTLPVILPMTTICVGRPAEQEMKLPVLSRRVESEWKLFYTICTWAVQALKQRMMRTVSKDTPTSPQNKLIQPNQIAPFVLMPEQP